MEQIPKKLPRIQALFTASWESYKVRAGQLALIMLLSMAVILCGMFAGAIVLAVGLGIAALGSGVAGGETGFVPGLMAAAPLPVILAILVGVLVVSIVSVYINIMLLLAAIEKPGQSISDLARKSKPFFLPMVVASLLSGLVIYGGMIIIVPGIFFAIALSFVSYVILTENVRGFAALQRSRELVRGYWWAVLGRVLLLGVSWMVVSFVVTEILSRTHLVSLQFIWSLAGVFIFSPFAIMYSTEIWRQLVSINSARQGDLADRWKYLVPAVVGGLIAVLLIVGVTLMGLFAGKSMLSLVDSFANNPSFSTGDDVDLFGILDSSFIDETNNGINGTDLIDSSSFDTTGLTPEEIDQLNQLINELDNISIPSGTEVAPQ